MSSTGTGMSAASRTLGFIAFAALGLLVGWSAYWPLLASQALRLALPGLLAVAAAAAYLVRPARPWFPSVLALFAVSLGLAITYFAGGLPRAWLGWPAATPAGVTAEKLGEVVPVAAVIVAVALLAGRGKPSLRLGAGRMGLGLLMSLVPLACLVGFFAAMGGFQGLRMLPPGTFVSWLPWLVTFSVLNGFMEELWFRGLWQDRFAGVLGPRTAVALATVIFTGMHVAAYWGAPALTLLPLTVAWAVLGFCCGWITRRSGTLWPAVLVHALYDFAYMIKYFSEL